MTFRKLIFWSIVGHLVFLGVLFLLGVFSPRPRPSVEILRPVNVQMVAREPPPPPPAPEPQPEPEPPPRPEPPPPRVEPPPPPPEPVRVIRPDPPAPDPEVAELQRRELEQIRERQRQREETQRPEPEPEPEPPPPPEPQREAVAVSESSVNLGSYAAMLVNSVSRHWRAQRQWLDTGLSVRIRLRVHRDGSFTETRIVTSSGDPSYDEAALRTLLEHPQGVLTGG